LASRWLKSCEHLSGQLLMSFFVVYFKSSSKANFSGF
jgi:hypothetical protein